MNNKKDTDNLKKLEYNKIRELGIEYMMPPESIATI